MIIAPIVEVKIYRNRAIVKRKATVGLRQGTNEVVISGISQYADPDSLRLFFTSGIIGKNIQITSLAETVERLPSEDLDDEINELQSQIETLNSLQSLWLSNGNFQTRGECSYETIENYLESLPTHLEKLRTKQNELNRRINALKEQKKIQKQKETFQAIKLVLESPQDCDAECEIEYLEKSVQWKSTYEIHAASDFNQITVVSRARITQNTGEDWENVQVFLFTGSPADRQRIPILKKMELGLRPVFLPPASAPFAAAKCDSDFKSTELLRTSSEAVTTDLSPVSRLSMEESEISDDETMTIYHLPGKYTVPSGTIGAMLDLKSDLITAEMRIVCVPKLDNNAYLAAFIKTEDWSLKPSFAKVYLNNNYCGEVYIAPNPSTEEVFMISLGRDERISLNYEIISAKTENLLFKGQKRKISEYAIRISNNSSSPQSVLIWDQIPISTDRQIAVENVLVDGASVDKETGKLSWSLTIEGKTTLKKRISYTVNYPKDKPLHEVYTKPIIGLRK